MAMALTYGNVHEFVRKNGKVVSLKPSDEVKILPNGEIDSIHLVENAERFVFEGKTYTRDEFEKLIDSSK